MDLSAVEITANVTNQEIVFTCENEIVLLNTTLARFACFGLFNDAKQVKGCEDACTNAEARTPYFDEFMRINRTLLESNYKNDTSISMDDFSFDVNIDYNFINGDWEANGDKLNLTWRFIEYPDLRDIIVVCFRARDTPTSTTIQADDNPLYCARSSTMLDYSRTDFYNHQFVDFALKHEVDQGYYVCAKDQLTLHSLKVGTLDEAHADCGGELLTPDLCDVNQSTTDTLMGLVREADRLNLISRRNHMWTGIRRFNETHFLRSHSKWMTFVDLGIEKGHITQL